MRVRIGPYKNFFGPFQLAEKLMFWVPKEKDEIGLPQTADRVHNFGEWLASGSVKPEPEVGDVNKLFDDDRDSTWLCKFLWWIDSKRHRKIKVKIDPWDTWNMETTLGYIVRPMLKQLKETKHGAPFVDLEDVPRELHGKKLTKKQKDNGEVDDKHFERWDWVMDEMIFAFESLAGGENEDWEDQFTTGEHDYRFKKISEDGMSEMIQGPNHTAETDWDARSKYQDRISNGFRLFGKYYQALWD